ncbi:MAG: hypothetical protein LBM99_00900 [Bacillales bacterium]|jgi:hypothetical protein|nr:hypothetical protein [Bacillales bacterium]
MFLDLNSALVGFVGYAYFFLIVIIAFWFGKLTKSVGAGFFTFLLLNLAVYTVFVTPFQESPLLSFSLAHGLEDLVALSILFIAPLEALITEVEALLHIPENIYFWGFLGVIVVFFVLFTILGFAGKDKLDKTGNVEYPHNKFARFLGGLLTFIVFAGLVYLVVISIVTPSNPPATETIIFLKSLF